MLLKISQLGFTLFETLIYIALFGFIMSGAIVSAYQIFEGTSQVQSIAQREIELNFLLRKINWAIDGATSVSTPSGDTLRLLNDGKKHEFKSSDDEATLTIDGETHALSSFRLNISDLTFNLSNTVPPQLYITMKIDGEEVGPISRTLR